MKTSRRSFFALFAGLGAAVAASKVKADVPPSPVNRMPAFTIPRGVLVESYMSPKCARDYSISDPTHYHSLTSHEVPLHSHVTTMLERIDLFNALRGDSTGIMASEPCVVMTLISTGRYLVPVDSDEGQAVLSSMAMNLRPDGTLIHRQHHWPR